MQIVAKVCNLVISDHDLARERSKVRHTEPEKDAQQALKRLIDRCLLYSQALQNHICVTDSEYDEALLELIGQDEPLGLSSEAIHELSAAEMEELLRRQIAIKKYLRTIFPSVLPIGTDKLLEFYKDNQEIFLLPAKVRCSHILIRGNAEAASSRAIELRSQIQNEEDFNRISKDYSDCPSNAACGDIGWFGKGKMIPEIDEVAFSLKVGEISQPFKSVYGYHILMLSDRQESQLVPFDDIRESLHARMQQIEKEYILSKHVTKLRREFAEQIVIYYPEMADI